MISFHHVFDVTPRPLLLADGGGVVLRANVAAGELFQRPCGAFVGESVSVVFDNWTDSLAQKVTVDRVEVPESDGRMFLYSIASRSGTDAPEKAATDSNVELEAVSHAFHDYIVVVDVSAEGACSIAQFNDAYLKGNAHHGIEIDPRASRGMDVRAFMRDVLKMNDDRMREAESRLRSVIDTSKPIRFEDDFVFPDGARVTVDSTLSPILSSDGRVARLLYFARNVSEQKRIEEALRASEFRWQYALDGAQDGLWDWHTDTGETFFSRRWKEMLGYADDELRNHFETWHDHIHPEDREATLNAVQQFLDGADDHYGTEHRLRCKDGSYKWILARGKALERAPDGRPLRVLGTHTDITETKTIIHALRETEDRFRALIEDLDVGVVLQDPDDQILVSNAAAQRILGLNENALEGVSSRDPRWRLVRADGTALPPEEVPSVIAARTLRPVMNVALGSSNINTGERRWLQISASPRLNANGSLLHTLVTILDITAEHQAKEALIESEAKERRLNQRFQMAAEAAGIGIWSYRISTQTLEWDESMLRIFRVAPGEFADEYTAFRDRVHPDDIERVDRARIEAVEKLTPYEADFRVVWPDNSIRYMRSFARAISSPNEQPDYMVGVCYDITAQRELEEQLRQAQKMQAVGQLAGGVAHDFNNLLTIINGYCEALLQDNLISDGPVRPQIEAIHQAGERAALLTQKLLIFSRKATTQTEIINLNHLLADTGEMLQRLIEEHITIETDERHPSLFVHSDRAHMEQAIVNLALNSRDAMKDGGVLRFVLDRVVFDEANPAPDGKCQNGPFVRLSVQDTGGGISADIRDRVFEPFFTTKGVGRGTGLGLATVFGVAEQAGGFVSFESAVGVGTHFDLYLPEAAAPAASQYEEMARPHAIVGGTETILLAEDEEMVRRVTRLSLEANGYTVIEASNGIEAVQRFRENRATIDMLLTDIMMPGMNGRQLAATLRLECPGLKVLFMSGYDNAESGPDAEKLGPFIAKPLRIPVLMAKIREVLEGSAG